jgi:hypothetical protein
MPITTPPTFFDEHDTEDPDGLPPPPIKPEVLPRGKGTPNPVLVHRVEATQHLFEYGTTPSGVWSDDWVRLVIEAEQHKKMAICGGQRKMADKIQEGEVDEEEIRENPILLVCKRPAGVGTNHPGEGRCIKHGGNVSAGTMVTGKSSFLKAHKLGPRIETFFNDDRLLDLRQAIATIYAGVDEALGIDEDVDMETAQSLAGMMAKVGVLVKQHNDIIEKKSIAIEVPEFMAWTEFYHELSIRYILKGDRDVAGFLLEARQFFDATVTLSIGIDGARAGNFGDGVAASGNGGHQ